MTHKSQQQLSPEDQEFLNRFEACQILPSNFRHRDHIKLAYIYLSQDNVNDASRKLRTSLQAFIRHNGVDESKYHETITYAWMLAVSHFMNSSDPTASSEEFIALNPKLMRKETMFSHYSRELLFSEDARGHFVEPDLEPIPQQV